MPFGSVTLPLGVIILNTYYIVFILPDSFDTLYILFFNPYNNLQSGSHFTDKKAEVLKSEAILGSNLHSITN